MTQYIHPVSVQLPAFLICKTSARMASNILTFQRSSTSKTFKRPSTSVLSQATSPGLCTKNHLLDKALQKNFEELLKQKEKISRYTLAELANFVRNPVEFEETEKNDDILMKLVENCYPEYLIKKRESIFHSPTFVPFLTSKNQCPDVVIMDTQGKLPLIVMEVQSGSFIDALYQLYHYIVDAMRYVSQYSDNIIEYVGYLFPSGLGAVVCLKVEYALQYQLSTAGSHVLHACNVFEHIQISLSNIVCAIQASTIPLVPQQVFHRLPKDGIKLIVDTVKKAKVQMVILFK